MRARASLAAEPSVGAVLGSLLDGRRGPVVRVRDGRAASSGGPFSFTATIGGRDVGGVHVDLVGPSEIAIHDLAVARPFRGAGVGAALMRAALSLGARLGRTLARLEADDDGSGKLIRWYRGLGFEEAGTSARGRPAMQADIRRALTWARPKPPTTRSGM